MPVISPFRALTYAPRLRAELDHLIAPPYDVIPAERRPGIAARHPNNIVHLDLPQDGRGGDRYARAAGLLRRWVDSGVLVRDGAPAVYVCEQRFTAPTGEERTRSGFFARLRLEPYGAGTIIPHERTLDGPRRDRQRLLRATRTHLSAILLIHPDPDGRVWRMTREAAASPVYEQARDPEGTLIRIVRLADREMLEALGQRLRDAWAIIADGHHRYEASLAYQEECRRAGRGDADHLLAFFCSLEDPGLAIFPIHRLVHSLEGWDPSRFRERLGEYFALRPLGSPEALRSAVDGGRGRSGVFGLVVRGERGGWLVEWKEGAGLDHPSIASVPPPLRRLDVILLHRLVMEGILGITPEAQERQAHLDYVRDGPELLRRMGEGRAQAGFLLNPTRMEQVIEVTRRGLRLPQKSTYFHPKVPTGLVLNPIDE
ncbi:MAG: DUF1015 domain-containing protein [Acidobacteriota bacterium]